MDADILFRTLLALAIIAIGVAVYGFTNRLVLARAASKFKALQGFSPGTPAILYFTTSTCAPCKTIQRPAIQQVKQSLGENVQIIEIDASERKDLADEWGVLSVPTTFILDENGQPRQINHGVARAEKLLAQLKN
jgi:thiol-disulfide isomerase/thioredoxin